MWWALIVDDPVSIQYCHAKNCNTNDTYPPTPDPTPHPNTYWMDGWIDIWKCECLFLASYPISSSTGSSISKLLPWLNRQCRKYCRLNVRLSDVIINLAPLARFPQSDTTLGLVSRSLHLLNPTSTLFTKNSILDLIRCPGKITSCSNRLGEAKVKSENIHILSSELTKDLSLFLWY